MTGGGGPLNSQVQDDGYDLGRLERAVSTLLDERTRLHSENAALRDQIERREQRLSRLDEELLDLNQRRRDAMKRLDDVIAQLDELETEFASREGRSG
jgi:chromosome segregation ATPase